MDQFILSISNWFLHHEIVIYRGLFLSQHISNCFLNVYQDPLLYGHNHPQLFHSLSCISYIYFSEIWVCCVCRSSNMLFIFITTFQRIGFGYSFSQHLYHVEYTPLYPSHPSFSPYISSIHVFTIFEYGVFIFYIAARGSSCDIGLQRTPQQILWESFSWGQGSVLRALDGAWPEWGGHESRPSPVLLTGILIPPSPGCQQEKTQTQTTTDSHGHHGDT